MRQVIRDEQQWVDSVAIVPPIYNVRDTITNQNSKTFVVPNNELWKLNFAHCIYTSDSDVGNRTISLQVLDADSNLVIDLVAGAVQAASLTRHYAFMQGVYRETSFVNDELHVPVPVDCYLSEGYTLKIFDGADIAATDDMVFTFQAMRYRV